MNLNKVILVGRVTADLQVKETKGGQKVLAFSLATNRTYTDKEKTKHEEVTFHNIVAWGRTAEIIAQYSMKGAELMVEGRITTRNYEDKAGVKRYVTEIVAENIQLGQKPGNAPKKVTLDPADDEVPGPGSANIDDEIKPGDLPF